MSAGDKRNGTRDYGNNGTQAGWRTWQHTGRPVPADSKTARNRAGKAVPAAAIAATLAAGAAAYVLTTPSSQPDPAKLTAALSAPAVLNAVTHAGLGKADADADAPASIRLTPHHTTTATAGDARSAFVGRPALTTPSAPSVSARQPSVAAPPAVAALPVAKPTPKPSRPPSATTSAPSPSATTTRSAATTTATTTAATVSCSGNSYLLPANVTAIVSFLLAHGYSDNAAAGIAGNIYQESKGNPESIGSGGGGLIGWTPLRSGLVTGNVSADLRTQLSAILTYNNGWSAYIPALNSAATPAAAASIYVTDFERAGIPAASTRESSAQAVASACGI